MWPALTLDGLASGVSARYLAWPAAAFLHLQGGPEALPHRFPGRPKMANTEVLLGRAPSDTQAAHRGRENYGCAKRGRSLRGMALGRLRGRFAPIGPSQVRRIHALGPKHLRRQFSLHRQAPVLGMVETPRSRGNQETPPGTRQKRWTVPSSTFPLARAAMMIEFSPSCVTVIVAEPVGVSTVPKSVTSTPAAVTESWSMDPPSSSPMSPTKATFVPSFAAAAA